MSGYEIIAFHSKGGMGEIFRARQVSIGREVALKVLHPELARRDPQFAKSFVDEARAAGRLNHPNIIAVHDVGKIKAADREEYLHYFSMEFVDGENLREVIDREGTCPQKLLNAAMMGMSEALVYAEQIGMVHRDIKPENIMVTKDGRIKLADFGLAQEMDSMDAAERDENGRVKVMGTPRYMSPEQARGRVLDVRSDQYSLGATLFHLLTGSPPYRRENGRATMKAHVNDPVPDPGELVHVPPAWRSLCMRMMAKSPDDRFLSSKDLRQAVEMAIQGKQWTEAGPRRRGRKNSADGNSPPSSPAIPMFAAAGAVVLIGIVLTLFLMPSGEEVQNSQQGPELLNEEELPHNEDERAAHIREQAETLLGQLPADPHTARKHLQEALAQDLFAADSEASDMLLERLQQEEQRIAEAENQRREQLQQHLRDARRHANMGDLTAARQSLANLSNDDQAWLGDDYQSTSDHVRGRAEALAADYARNLDSANNRDDLQAILEQAQAVGLGPDLIANLEQRQQERLNVLKRSEEEIRNKELAAQQERLNAFFAKLNEHRSSSINDTPDFSRFIAVANDHRRRFEHPESRQLCARLLRIGELGREMHRAFNRYITTTQPEIHLQWLGSVEQAQIVEVVSDGVVLLFPSNNARIKKRFSDPEIDHAQLVHDAQEHFELEEDALAAYLWLWRHSDSKKHPLSDDQLLATSRQMTGQGALSTEQEEPASTPDANGDQEQGPPFVGQELHFADADKKILDHFSGEGLRLIDTGLHWLCEDTLRLNDLNESKLPTLSLQYPLKRPLRLELDVQVESGSLIMLGLQRGAKRIRLGLDTRNNRIGGIITGSGEQIKSSPLPIPDSRVNNPLTVVITVDQAGVVRFFINDTPYDAPEDLFQFSEDGDHQLIIQALNTNNASAMTLSRLLIEPTP